jgi:predicted Zn-dependent peptidase
MSDLYQSQTFMLPSGLQVIAVHRPGSKSFAAALMYIVGTFDDPPGMPGAAHFAEHLAFNRKNQEIWSELAGRGTHINGGTGYDWTDFTAAGHVDDLQLTLKFLASILRNRDVAAEEIANERSIFLHELKEDSNISTRETNLNKFWRRTLGDPNWHRTQDSKSVNVKKFTPAAMNAFKERYYDPANASLAIVSPVAAIELQHRLEQLSPHEPRDNPSADPVHNRISPTRKPLFTSWDRYGYIWVDMTFSVPSTTPVMRFTASIIGHLLGGGQHSELFEELRAKRGIAYQVYANDWKYLACTVTHSFFSVPKRSVCDGLAFVVDRVNQFATHGVTELQLEREKQRLIRWHEMGIDHPRGLASHLAYEALRPPSTSLINPLDYHRAVASISLADVNQAAAELLSPNNRATFIGGRIGPIAKMRIKRILNRHHRTVDRSKRAV